MKKILSIVVAFAAIFAIASCGSGNEKKSDPATKVIESLEKLHKQLDDETPDAFIKTYEEMDKYYKSLSDEDKKNVKEARRQWAKDNEEKYEELEEALRYLDLL